MIDCINDDSASRIDHNFVYKDLGHHSINLQSNVFPSSSLTLFMYYLQKHILLHRLKLKINTMNNISSSIPTQSDYMSIVKTLDKNDSTSEVTTEQNLKGRRVSFFDESSASIHMMDLLPHPLLTDVDYSNDDGMEIEEVDDNVLLQLDSKTKGRRVSLEPTQLIRFDMIPSPIDFEDDINIDNLEDEETKIAANKDVTTKSDSHKIASTLEDQKREDPPKRRHSEKTLEKLKEILSRGPSLSKRRRSTRSEAHIDCSEDEKEDFVDDDEEYIPTSKKPLLSINSRSSKKSSDSSFGQSGTEKVTVKRNSVNKDDVLSGRGMASSSHPGKDFTLRIYVKSFFDLTILLI